MTVSFATLARLTYAVHQMDGPAQLSVLARQMRYTESTFREITRAAESVGAIKMEDTNIYLTDHGVSLASSVEERLGALRQTTKRSGSSYTEYVPKRWSG